MLQSKLVLSTGHRKEFQTQRFERWPFVRAKDYRSLRSDEIIMLYPSTDAASQFPYIRVLTRLLFYINHEFGCFFSFYSLNTSIVIEHLYKTFGSIFKNLLKWSGSAAN